MMRARRAYSPLALAVSALALVGCDAVERETVDRVTPHDATAWSSREDCQDLVASRSTVSRPPRVATWNIRYFPDTEEEEVTDADEATDVPWVACAIASLDVDVLVVQEIKNSESGLEKQQELIQELNALTGGSWRIEVDQCMPAEVQHPGFIFDESRVHGDAFREISEMLPDPVCSNQVSPGFAGYFSIDGGPDFNLIAVHAAAGPSSGSFAKRAFTTDAIAAVTAEAISMSGDTDVIFAGDFNSVGCQDCDPVVSSDDEIAKIEQAAADVASPLRLLPATEKCTRFAEDSPLIDHVLVSVDMSEVPQDAQAKVGGICEETSCGRQLNWLEDAYDRLSDHCPVVVELAAEDDDP